MDAQVEERSRSTARLDDAGPEPGSLRSLAEGFRALADETRLQILHLLMTRGEMCVCEFMELLEATQSNVSFHLKSLKYAEFVTSRKEGKWMYYSLSRKALESFRGRFGDVFDLARWPERAVSAEAAYRRTRCR